MSNTINPNLPPTASTQSGEQVTPAADAAAVDKPREATPEDLEKFKAAMDQQQKMAMDQQQKATSQELLLAQMENNMKNSIQGKT